MKKVGPIIIIIASIISILSSLFVVLIASNVLNSISFLHVKLKEISTSLKVFSIFSLIVGIVLIILASITLVKPRGVAAIILMVLVGIQLGIQLYQGSENGFSFMIILSLALYGFAELGMAYGYVTTKKRR